LKAGLLEMGKNTCSVKKKKKKYPKKKKKEQKRKRGSEVETSICDIRQTLQKKSGKKGERRKRRKNRYINKNQTTR